MKKDYEQNVNNTSEFLELGSEGNLFRRILKNPITWVFTAACVFGLFIGVMVWDICNLRGDLFTVTIRYLDQDTGEETAPSKTFKITASSSNNTETLDEPTADAENDQFAVIIKFFDKDTGEELLLPETVEIAKGNCYDVKAPTIG